ncbi:Ketol-acid reductoisomerase [Purpureocillium lavendulum]|uniref:MICOS complex subunit MIC12 n=1 Tax=Purpureocillium lavendulum TaxID=1247861 RepID=A0AB34FMP6_9HYPO|nr:Ketol-acid reductoisomerase [Purpureocillium lavendulum]
MGFVTGFTGGVTLTLSLAYLSVLAHQRTRENQARHLRAQALALQTLVDPIPQPLPPSRSEVAAAQRAASVEVAKDRWNEEVENAVRWVQSTDWVDVREDLEARVAGLWARAFGEAVDGAERAGDKLEPAVRRAESATKEAGSSIASAGKAAFDKAKARGAQYESTMEDRALEARLAGRRKVEKAEGEAKQKASEAQGAIASALEKGRDKAHEVVDKVKSAVGLAEEKVASAAAATVNGTAQSPVEKALQQRYEKPEAKVNRTVAEVLRERYTPIDQRDNTVLRGL